MASLGTVACHRVPAGHARQTDCELCPRVLRARANHAHLSSASHTGASRSRMQAAGDTGTFAAFVVSA